MTHCDKILARLRRGPATAGELYALGTVAHSRVSDLRKRGHVIEHTVDRGVHIYTLIGSLERGEPKADNDEVAAPAAVSVSGTVPCESSSPLSSDAAHQAGTVEPPRVPVLVAPSAPVEGSSLPLPGQTSLFELVA